MDNVTIFQTYEDQKKDQGREGEIDPDHPQLDAKGMWECFNKLRGMRDSTTKPLHELAEDMLRISELRRFIKFYPSLSAIAVSHPDESELNYMRQMMDQKRMQEENPNYTLPHADAAMKQFRSTVYASERNKEMQQKNIVPNLKTKPNQHPQLRKGDAGSGGGSK